jgi:hypothetical protein
MSLSTLGASVGDCAGNGHGDGHVQALEQRPGVEGRDSLRRVSGMEGRRWATVTYSHVCDGRLGVSESQSVDVSRRGSGAAVTGAGALDPLRKSAGETAAAAPIGGGGAGELDAALALDPLPASSYIFYIFTRIPLPPHAMVLALALKAQLNGVTDLRPLDTEDAPFYYTFKVQCTSCRETHPNPVSVSRFEQNDMSGSRGEANFVWKCKNCGREHSANIKAAPASYPLSDPPKLVNILEFDCRGLEFTEFKADVCFDPFPSSAHLFLLTLPPPGRVPGHRRRDRHKVHRRRAV